MNNKKVWFVTGASKGLGLALVKKLLIDGYQVAATSRSIDKFVKEIGYSDDFLPLEMDLVDESSVSKSIAQAVKTFGRIDVVVNNAGYGQLGTIEELTDREARENFDTNVFGLLNVMRSVLPNLRRQKSGHIINISSIVGFMGTFPGWGIYNATKFAVAGLTEAFSAEAASLGIKSSIIYPGYFRTNFLEQDSLRLAQQPVDDYKEARDLENAHLNQIKGTQPGDPEKAAVAIIRLAENENPALHFFMGSDAFGLAGTKIQTLQKDLSENEALSKSTDY
ncbi:SDR family NAD(P)-dependent oxidoreductase [Pedobacter sp. 22163]|uniref:SDR family NAD(P)-dependent oxidoreductase n=1 Tax=Pedobacter sp. 22163 TaxID=3453883 RepID=UPI003F82496A